MVNLFIAHVFFKFNFEILKNNELLLSDEGYSVWEKLLEKNFNEEERSIIIKIHKRDELELITLSNYRVKILD